MRVPSPPPRRLSRSSIDLRDLEQQHYYDTNNTKISQADSVSSIYPLRFESFLRYSGSEPIHIKEQQELEKKLQQKIFEQEQLQQHIREQKSLHKRGSQSSQHKKYNFFQPFFTKTKNLSFSDSKKSLRDNHQTSNNSNNNNINKLNSHNNSNKSKRKHFIAASETDFFKIMRSNSQKLLKKSKNNLIYALSDSDFLINNEAILNKSDIFKKIFNTTNGKTVATSSATVTATPAGTATVTPLPVGFDEAVRKSIERDGNSVAIVSLTAKDTPDILIGCFDVPLSPAQIDVGHAAKNVSTNTCTVNPMPIDKTTSTADGDINAGVGITPAVKQRVETDKKRMITKSDDNVLIKRDIGIIKFNENLPLSNSCNNFMDILADEDGDVNPAADINATIASTAPPDDDVENENELQHSSPISTPSPTTSIKRNLNNSLLPPDFNYFHNQHNNNLLLSDASTISLDLTMPVSIRNNNIPSSLQQTARLLNVDNEYVNNLNAVIDTTNRLDTPSPSPNALNGCCTANTTIRKRQSVTYNVNVINFQQDNSNEDDTFSGMALSISGGGCGGGIGAGAAGGGHHTPGYGGRSNSSTSKDNFIFNINSLTYDFLSVHIFDL